MVPDCLKLLSEMENVGKEQHKRWEDPKEVKRTQLEESVEHYLNFLKIY